MIGLLCILSMDVIRMKEGKIPCTSQYVAASFRDAGLGFTWQGENELLWRGRNINNITDKY